MRLTWRQRDALSALAREGEGSAYGLKVWRVTLQRLADLGLAIAIGRGHMAFPDNGVFRITPAGRKAVEAFAPGAGKAA